MANADLYLTVPTPREGRGYFAARSVAEARRLRAAHPNAYIGVRTVASEDTADGREWYGLTGAGEALATDAGLADYVAAWLARLDAILGGAPLTPAEARLAFRGTAPLSEAERSEWARLRDTPARWLEAAARGVTLAASWGHGSFMLP